MLNNADLYADGIETLDISGESGDTAKYKAVTQKIVDVVTDFALPSASNNKLSVLTVTPKSKCVLVIKQTLLNHINIDFLAGVFNLEKTELIKNIIPVRSFQVINPADPDGSIVGEDIDFVVLDEEGFDIHNALEDSGMIYNPKGKYTNHFTNDWKIFAFKTYANARAFKITYTASNEVVPSNPGTGSGNN